MARSTASAGRSHRRLQRTAAHTAGAGVSAAQRTRIISAMIELAGEREPDGVTIARVVARAGVSSRTFYEQFEGRGDCLRAALAHALELCDERMRSGCAMHTRWLERVRGGLFELLCFFEEQPRLARLIVVHSASAPEAAQLRAQVLERLAGELDRGRPRGRTEPLPLSAQAMVGGVASVLHSRLLRAQPGALSELLNPLMSMIALAYLGPDAASRELHRQPPPRERTGAPAQADTALSQRLRLTSRTLAVLDAIASEPGLSNRQVAARAGIADQGQASRLLGRLSERGLAENTGAGQSMGAANAWRLTRAGERLARVISRGV